MLNTDTLDIRVFQFWHKYWDEEYTLYTIFCVKDRGEKSFSLAECFYSSQYLTENGWPYNTRYIYTTSTSVSPPPLYHQALSRPRSPCAASAPGGECWWPSAPEPSHHNLVTSRGQQPPTFLWNTFLLSWCCAGGTLSGGSTSDGGMGWKVPRHPNM